MINVERDFVMKKLIKDMLSVMGEHLLGIVISVALLWVAGTILRSQVWLASVLTSIVYLSSMYSKAWKNSGKDLRWANAHLKSGESDTLNYRIYDGFIHAIPVLVISVILYVLSLTLGNIFVTVFRIYNLPFVMLYDKKSKIPPEAVGVLSVILPYICYGVGYIVGKSRKTFVVQHLGKLVYKQKKKDTK